MSATVVTLDSIREAAEAKYGALEVPLNEEYTVRLLNPLRLSKDKRTELISLQEAMGEDGADAEALLSRAIMLIAATEAQGSRLLEAINGDLAVLTEVFSNYSRGVQVGEASASAD